MLNIIKCFIFGHIQYKPIVLNNNHIILIRDNMGDPLVSIDVCKRCGAVYSTFTPKD